MTQAVLGKLIPDDEAVRLLDEAERMLKEHLQAGEEAGEQSSD